MSGDLTPTELRVKVAEAMGWDVPHEFDCISAWSPPDGLGHRTWMHLPDFGAPDWSATGAVLDEMARREMSPDLAYSLEFEQWHAYAVCSLMVGDASPHVAVCKAFLKAVARAKEPHDAR